MNIELLNEMISRAFDESFYTSYLHVDVIKQRIEADLNISTTIEYIKWVLQQLQDVGHIIQMFDNYFRLVEKSNDLHAAALYEMMKRSRQGL